MTQGRYSATWISNPREIRRARRLGFLLGLLVGLVIGFTVLMIDRHLRGPIVLEVTEIAAPDVQTLLHETRYYDPENPGGIQPPGCEEPEGSDSAAAAPAT